MTDWRADPGWELVGYDTTHFPQPPEQPTPEAELCGVPQGGLWAEQFLDHRSVATWRRPPSVSRGKVRE